MDEPGNGCPMELCLDFGMQQRLSNVEPPDLMCRYLVSTSEQRLLAKIRFFYKVTGGSMYARDHPCSHIRFLSSSSLSN